MKIVSFLTVAIFSFGAHAFNLICGDKINLKNMTAASYVLEISSEDGEFDGPSGGTWSIKFQQGQDAPWIKDNPNVTAKAIEANNKTNVEVTVVTGNSPSGPVGNIYLIKNIFNRNSSLEKYTLGGFAGKVLERKAKCVSLED